MFPLQHHPFIMLLLRMVRQSNEIILCTEYFIFIISVDTDTSIIDLMKFLESKLQSHWYCFGHHLKIPMEELHRIQLTDGQASDRCTRQVFSSWRRSNQVASWEPIVEALKQSGLSLLSDIVFKRYKNPDRTFCQICHCSHGLDFKDVDIHDVLSSTQKSMSA